MERMVGPMLMLMLKGRQGEVQIDGKAQQQEKAAQGGGAADGA
jgi:hypothetical protein